MMNTPEPPQATEATVFSDQELVVRAQAGDTRALEELFRHHQPRAYLLARSLCHGHTEDAKETSQNALLQAYRHLGNFRGDSKFSTWLYRIVINECRQHWLRQSKETRWIRLEERTEEQEPADANPDPEEQFALHEFQVELEHCLAELPDRLSLPFVLRQVERLPNRHIAALLGLSVSAVKNLQVRARLRLRSCLGNSFCSLGRGDRPGAAQFPPQEWRRNHSAHAE